MARRGGDTDQFIDLSFPLGGIDRSRAFGRQQPRPLPTGEYARTTPVGINVRGYEPTTGRARGGTRAGLSHYIATIPGGSAGLIQELAMVVGAGYTPPGGGGQSSQSNRVVTLVAVIGGNVYVADVGGTSWTAATNDTGFSPPLRTSGAVRSCVHRGKLYFFDGTRACYYDPALNKVRTWGASAGSFPANSAGTEFCRLGCTWRDRVVHSGLEDDPQNWFCSKGGDATNYNYGDATRPVTMAAAGTNGDQGLVGDVVTGLVPYSRDLLLFLCDSSLWQLAGDPMEGGRLDRITGAIGGAFGTAWCCDPQGAVWFVGSRGGLYRMAPGQPPIRVSQPIDRYLDDIDTGASLVRLLWDTRQQGMHIFVTAAAASAAATHFYYEARSGAFWVDRFANPDLNPIACVILDGNDASDRVPLIGSWDGYVRAIDPDATRDDRDAISSEVWLGPLLTQDLDDLMLHELQAVLGESSGDVDYAIHVGLTAEAALASEAVETGTWSASLNLAEYVRQAGHAVFVRLTSTVSWQLEALRARVESSGRIRRRAIY